MCKYKPLHYNRHGYIVRCKSCSHFQIAFGNIAVTADEQEFECLTNSVYNFCEKNNIQSCPHFRNISIKTPASNVMLLFNNEEIKQFKELLQEAQFALEIEKLIACED